KVFFALRVVAVVEDVVHAQVGMRAVGQADGAGGARDFFHGDEMRQISHARPAVRVRHGDAEQAHVAEFLPQVGRKEVVTIDGFGARRNFLFGKSVHAFAQHVDVVTEGEWAHGLLPKMRTRNGGTGNRSRGRENARLCRSFPIPRAESRLRHCPRMRPAKRGALLPMCDSLILPMALMRSSAMRSAAL